MNTPGTSAAAVAARHRQPQLAYVEENNSRRTMVITRILNFELSASANDSDTGAS
ncbi:MAG: hypothetical protein WCF03_01535 [Nitrososphaeraceae archaeon]